MPDDRNTVARTINQTWANLSRKLFKKISSGSDGNPVDVFPLAMGEGGPRDGHKSYSANQRTKIDQRPCQAVGAATWLAMHWRVPETAQS
jgi:hypothetical protein